MTALHAAAVDAGRVSRTKLVDADVHPLPRSGEEMRAHLAEPWRSAPAQVFSDLASVLYYPPAGGLRGDAGGAGGARPGSDHATVENQLLRDAGVDYAVLIPQVRAYSNVELEAALCAAANRWMAETWLGEYNPHGRYRGSICVAMDAPQAAVEEIETWAGHPHFAQVRVNAYARSPYGNERYDPVYEAATRHGLPVAMHFSKGDGLALATPVGFGTSFFEQHSLYPLTYASHLASLVLEGALERFSSLRFVMVEGGFSWLLPLLWRLDRFWEELRGQPPAPSRRPSHAVQEQIRFTTQPIEEPPRARWLADVLEWAGAEGMLMFSSDYPHWDYDDPQRTLVRFPRAVRTRIASENARELYGLPEHRPDLDARDHRA